MALEKLLQNVSLLEQAIDIIIDTSDADSPPRADADWAWYRLSSAATLVRQKGGGALAATLARGLLEEAAYWDWALALGIGREHLSRRAMSELQRLRSLAREIDDDIWIGWLLPPGTEIITSTDAGVPDAAQVVQRLGFGFEEPILAPLQFAGAVSAYRLLEVLTHGNFAAALTMAAGGGQELTDPLASAVIHVAAAGATAVTIAQLDLTATLAEALTEMALDIAEEASTLHGLPLGRARAAKRPARAQLGHRHGLTSGISRMPSAAESMTAAGLDFCTAAERLCDVAVANFRQSDDGAKAAWVVFQLSWSQMLIFKGAMTGQMGRALLPFAARALLEDGTRWEWVRRQAVLEPTGESLRAVVADSKGYITRIYNGLIADGVPISTASNLLGHAVDLLVMEPGDASLPSISELLPLTNQTRTNVESARPMYSVLSQFIHSTPLSLLHIRRAHFPTLTAPVYAIAVEAACRGFWNIALATLSIACIEGADLEGQFEQLARALGAVISEATRWHMLG